MGIMSLDTLEFLIGTFWSASTALLNIQIAYIDVLQYALRGSRVGGYIFQHGTVASQDSIFYTVVFAN